MLWTDLGRCSLLSCLGIGASRETETETERQRNRETERQARHTGLPAPQQLTSLSASRGGVVCFAQFAPQRQRESLHKKS